MTLLSTALTSFPTTPHPPNWRREVGDASTPIKERVMVKPSRNSPFIYVNVLLCGRLVNLTISKSTNVSNRTITRARLQGKSTSQRSDSGFHLFHHQNELA